MIPNNGPKNELKVSTNDKIPIWLNTVTQKIPIRKLKINIMKLALFKFKELGKKLISEYWDGIKLATKLVDADDIIIKKNRNYSNGCIVKFTNYISWIG